MLDQELASAMKFIIETAGTLKPYYYEVPQDFEYPAVFFPQPDIVSFGDTLKTYALSYNWYIKFFHKDTQSAQAVCFKVLEALQYRRRNVPLIASDGSLTGKTFKLNDPTTRPLDHAAQLTLSWDSPRPYHMEHFPKVEHFDLTLITKNAFNNALTLIGEKHD